jgi:hypothetical protein
LRAVFGLADELYALNAIQEALEALSRGLFIVSD